MKPFSLEEYLKNPSMKVITRNGRKVRIICTDMNCQNYPIIALLKQFNDNYEDIFSYTKDGKWRVNESTRHDLFFAPEKHEGWINVYRHSDGGHAYAGAVYDSKEDAEKRKIIDENYVTTIKLEWEE